MNNEKLKKLFFSTVEKIAKKHNISENELHSKITPENVFQKAITFYRDEFDEEFTKFAVKGDSKIIGTENIKKFHDFALQGKTCLILARHVGNFDVPNLYHLMKNQNLLDIFNDIVFIAGRKLNEEYDLIRLLTIMFPRIVIIPKGEDAEQAKSINLAAWRELQKIKKQSKMILLYPTGTREREWDPNSFKGIRETYNYVKSFDHIIFLNVQGNTLIPSPETMINDKFVNDTIIFTFSQVHETKSLLDRIINENKNKKTNDTKQFVADKLVDIIRSL